MIIGKTNEVIQRAKDVIRKDFAIKDGGPITRIVGIDIERGSHGLILKQKSFLSETLKNQGTEKLNKVKTPMEPDAVSRMTTSCETEGVVENHWYRSIVGELLYATVCTRPDLSFAVNLCARGVENPNNNHKQAIKRILRYVSGTLEHGLIYKGTGKEPRLVVYCDSDFAMDKSDSKSTTGFVICLNGCTIAWCTGKQKAVSTSTVEAEYIAACMATKEAVWIQYLMTEILGYSGLQCPMLLLDNQGAETLAQNDGVSNKTKHIRYSYHFIRSCHEAKMIAVRHVAGVENHADMFTKPLAYDKFLKHCQGIHVMDNHMVKVQTVFTNRGYLKVAEK
jgi:hypothetical protein